MSSPSILPLRPVHHLQGIDLFPCYAFLKLGRLRSQCSVPSFSQVSFRSPNPVANRNPVFNPVLLLSHPYRHALKRCYFRPSLFDLRWRLGPSGQECDSCGRVERAGRFACVAGIRARQREDVDHVRGSEVVYTHRVCLYVLYNFLQGR